MPDYANHLSDDGILWESVKQGDRLAFRQILTGTMLAVDQPTGQLLELAPRHPTASTALTQQLPRPIESTPGDVNRDGLTDWLVCGFGHNAGGLYLLHTLTKTSGCSPTISAVALRNVLYCVSRPSTARPVFS